MILLSMADPVPYLLDPDPDPTYVGSLCYAQARSKDFEKGGAHPNKNNANCEEFFFTSIIILQVDNHLTCQ